MYFIALFCSDDVDGQDIFKFKSRHTKNDLQNIVKSAVNSPMMTPSKSRTALLNGSEATPRHVTDIMKKSKFTLIFLNTNLYHRLTIILTIHYFNISASNGNVSNFLT